MAHKGRGPGKSKTAGEELSAYLNKMQYWWNNHPITGAHLFLWETQYFHRNYIISEHQEFNIKFQNLVFVLIFRCLRCLQSIIVLSITKFTNKDNI